MSKDLKKCLLVGTSALMFLSVGVGAINSPVSARRHYRTHRVYRHRRAHATLNTWYERNGKAMKRRSLHHNRMFTQGWKDSHYNWADMNYARINPRRSNNTSYRHGWIIGRTYANNNRTFKRYKSYWSAIHEYSAGSAYASMYRIHHNVYSYAASDWAPSVGKAYANMR